MIEILQMFYKQQFCLILVEVLSFEKKRVDTL